MIQFTCRWCQKTAGIDQFRSRYTEVCIDCYKADIARKNILPHRRYGRMKYQAKKAGREVTLTLDEYTKIIELPCHYCGTTLVDTGWGIDRKDNTRGYSADNVVPSCSYCNWVKRDTWTYEEMLQLGAVVRQLREKRASDPNAPSRLG